MDIPPHIEEIIESLNVGRKQFDIMTDAEELILAELKQRLAVDPELPQITFVRRLEHTRVALGIGFQSGCWDQNNAQKVQKIFTELAQELNDSDILNLELRMPRNGEFLLFSVDQALIVVAKSPASNLPQFNNIRRGFEAVMTLEDSPYKKPEDAFKVFALYADRCLEMQFLREAKTCVIHLDRLLEDYLASFAAASISDHVKLNMIEIVGVLFDHCDELEKSIEVALKYSHLLTNAGEKYQLEQLLARWIEKRERQEEIEEDIREVVDFARSNWNIQKAA